MVLLGVILTLTSVQCDSSCNGRDGHAGVNGAPGRDGLAGAKGEKGEPAVMVQGPADSDVLRQLKGEVGSRGPPGDMGPKGYRGEVGTAGRPGNKGQPGPNGENIGHGSNPLQQTHSAFSAIRTDTSYPPYNQKVTYQTTVVNNPGHFDAGTGLFTCKIPGVYYFSFHCAAKVSICLHIASDALTSKLGFCDNNRNLEQAMSGGVVLELALNQTVWLESFKDKQTANDARDIREKKIIFNGFLLFADKE